MRIMIKGGVWKNTEDEILKAAVMKYGKNQWARVASLLTRKSAKQCKARWYEWLEPSIKKVEWSREEEEKLLHLVKLMPSQWRTIAPLVGRTAAQCMEHYEYLLDSIAENKEGNNEENSKSNKNNLQLGEIDPIPETKPARPDPIDMDEDEKEMLSEARARLANTKGKKAKRKAREKQLQEAKKLTILQKKRELKAAGIYSGNSQQHLHNKKRKFIDYIKEIPFEKNVPIGLHDINHENMIDNTLSLRSAAKEAMKNEEKRRDAQEKKQRQIDTKRQKVLEKIALDEHIKRINQINDPHSHIKKQALKLSAPEMTNEEYEHAMKISKNNIDLLKQLKATGNGAQQATNSLLSEIQISETPYRSSETDSILLTQRRNKEQESERKFQYDIYNLAAARHAQTPLLGGSNVEVQGENLPYQKDIDSTETETKKNNASSRFATPLSNIWTASRINENALESIQEEDEDDKKLRRRMKQLENEKKQKLLYGFKKLPEPMNEYKLVVPERKENLEDEYVSKIAIAEEDAEEIANRVRETEKARMELDLKLISNSNRKALPIPKLKQLENLLQLDEKEVEHLRLMNKDIDVEREIRQEMAKLIKGDMNQKRDASLPKYHKDYTLSELQRARNMVEMEMICHCNYQSPTVRDQLSENVVGMAETKKKCHILLKKLKKQQKENDKINKKLKLLMNGYEIYEGQNNLEIMQALEQLSQKRIEEDFYRKLAANEKDYIIKKRVVELSEELEKYKKMEKELQELYYATHA